MLRPREEVAETGPEVPADVQIERMTLWDVDEVLLIENQSFPAPWPAWAFVQELRSGRSVCLVARVVGSLAGYAVAWLLKRELHIGNLAVADGYKRKGIGSTLLRELLAIADGRGVEMVTLEVRASNTAAISLYEKLGFTKIAIKRDYYRCEGEDALVMALRTI